MRTHRAPIEKLLYSDVFRCTKCDHRMRRFRPALESNFAFILSRHTCCIRCGSDEVHRMMKRDRIDSLSKHPLSWLFRLTGAPLIKCPACRLQYYDWRPFSPDVDSAP